MKLLLVINPVSGDTPKGELLNYARNRCHFLGIKLSVYRTTGNNDVEELQQRIATEQPDRIASVGGDGTFMLAVEATRQHKTPIGFVPMGSANGMAKELGVSPDPEIALNDLIASHRIVPLDLLKINDRHLSLHMGDVGLNANMVADFEADGGRGMATYGKYLLRTLTQMDEFEYSFVVGGKEHKGRAVMISFGNGTRFGTGIPVNTVGNPFDGKFEITIIKEINADILIRAGLSMISEHFLRESETTVVSAELATLHLKPEQMLQLDGEVIGKTSEVKIEIEPGAVPLITTGRNPYLGV